MSPSNFIGKYISCCKKMNVHTLGVMNVHTLGVASLIWKGLHLRIIKEYPISFSNKIEMHHKSKG